MTRKPTLAFLLGVVSSLVVVGLIYLLVRDRGLPIRELGRWASLPPPATVRSMSVTMYGEPRRFFEVPKEHIVKILKVLERAHEYEHLEGYFISRIFMGEITIVHADNKEVFIWWHTGENEAGFYIAESGKTRTFHGMREAKLERALSDAFIASKEVQSAK